MKQPVKNVGAYSPEGKLIKVYPSSSQAARDLGANSSNIDKAIKKDIKCHGYYWRHVVDGMPDKIEVRKYIRSKRAVPVDIYIRPMKLFGTASCIQEAADMTNLTRNSVRIHLRAGTWTNKSATRWRKEALPDYLFKVSDRKK